MIKNYIYCNKCNSNLLNINTNIKDHPYFCEIYCRINNIYIQQQSNFNNNLNNMSNQIDKNSEKSNEIYKVFEINMITNKRNKEIIFNNNLSIRNETPTSNMSNTNLSSNTSNNSCYSSEHNKTTVSTQLNISSSSGVHSRSSIFSSRSIRRLFGSPFNLEKVKEIFDSLPCSKIHDPAFLPDEKKRCVVCMEDYNVNDIVKTLDCLHIFHYECISGWIMDSKHTTCPICSFKLMENTLTSK